MLHFNKLMIVVSLIMTLLPHSFAHAQDKQPFDLGASYEMGYQPTPLKGGDGSSAKQRLTFNILADTAALVGLENGSVFFQYQNHNGEHGVNNVGDIQQFDGLDDPEYNRIHMFWYQHILLDGDLRVKVGKVEPKSEFFAPENARNHLGFSTERSPTIIAQGPPSMSINAFYSPTDNLTLAVGVYDASWNQGADQNNFKLRNFFDAEDYAYFLEGRYTWTQGLNNLPGGIKVGAWQLDGTVIEFDGNQKENTSGLYFVYDQDISDNGVGVYAQFGLADKKVSNLSRHVGLGMQWKGPIASRMDDVFGAGISTVKFSSSQGSPFLKDSETAFEVFYKAPLKNWFIVQADLQYITNPGGQTHDNVLVSTFRATLAF